MHALDFPRVPQVDIKKDGIQEVYVIHDYENHRAPVRVPTRFECSRTSSFRTTVILLTITAI